VSWVLAAAPEQKRRGVTWGRRCASVEIPVVKQGILHERLLLQLPTIIILNTVEKRLHKLLDSLEANEILKLRPSQTVLERQ